ncbi:hypothetical protein ACFLZW_05900 [Chloroflexota bacterium]
MNQGYTPNERPRLLFLTAVSVVVDGLDIFLILYLLVIDRLTSS